MPGEAFGDRLEGLKSSDLRALHVLLHPLARAVRPPPALAFIKPTRACLRPLGRRNSGRMGISWANGVLSVFHEVVRSQRLVVAGLRMAELGNQKIRSEVLGHSVDAKKFFTAMGFDHTSIDINGKDGALPLDLRLPIARPDLLGSFDLVTNFGTLEHVSRQYPAWKNVHELAKPGGLFLHFLPETGSWPGHCEFRYDGRFVPALAALCGYEILKHGRHEIDADHRFVVAVLRRTGARFPAEAEFLARVPIDGPA